MKTKLNFMIFLVAFGISPSISMFGQEKGNLSISYNYPVTIGYNFMSTEGIPSGSTKYVGVGDLGITYNFKNKHSFIIGAGMDFKYFVKSLADNNWVHIIIVNPSGSFGYRIKWSNKVSLIPVAGVGYDLAMFYYKDSDGKHSKTENGVEIKAEIRLAVAMNSRISLYLLAGYDYMRLFPTDEELKVSYNQDIQTFYPGIGLTINL